MNSGYSLARVAHGQAPTAALLPPPPHPRPEAGPEVSLLSLFQVLGSGVVGTSVLRIAGHGDSWLPLGAALPVRSLLEGSSEN